MTDIAAIEQKHIKGTHMCGNQFWDVSTHAAGDYCDTVIVLARLREVEARYDALRDANAADEKTFRKVKAERDAYMRAYDHHLKATETALAERDRWRTSWENDVDTVARSRDAAEADAKALEDALRTVADLACQDRCAPFGPEPEEHDRWHQDAMRLLAARRERVKE